MQIGMVMDDVKYVKGVPDYVLGQIETEGDWKGSRPLLFVKDFEKGQKLEDYSMWGFQGLKSRIDITFYGKRLIAIQCFSEDKRARCPAIGGIRDGDTEQAILQRLGTPDQTEIENDFDSGGAKQMRFSKGAFFYLTREEVYMLGIDDASYKWQ